MPRQTFDIKEFKYGIISSMDEEDIPPESASDSLNVDGDVGEGILQGIPADVEYQTTGDVALTNIRLGELIEDSDIYYAIYHDSSANKITGIKNFQSSTVASRIKQDLVTANISDNTTMVTNNKEVHIGTGFGSANVPKWIGNIEHYQFGMVAADYNDSYTGTGQDDLTADTSGYTGVLKRTYYVVIDATDTPDTFRWGIGTSEIATGVSITGAAQTLTDGTYSISILFDATKGGAHDSTTGHDLADIWYIDTPGLYVEDAECDKPLTAKCSIGVTEVTGAGGFFTTLTKHNWKISYVYDGYQESPLTITDTIDSTGGADAEYYTIKITATGTHSYPESFNRRVTGINLYRADSTDATLANLGLYRLVASISMSDGWVKDGAGGAFNRAITLYDYGTFYSWSVGGTAIAGNPVTYNDNAGISETLSSTIVNYALSTKGNGYHFVGKCYHALIPDAERYIFKSRYLRYDMFDWTADLLVMPEPITALVFYDGKLWAFSLNKTYRINSDGLYIEDVFDDAGAQGQRAVHTNEYGMFFGNFENAWMYQGGTFHRIGDAIRQSASGGKSWQTFTHNTLTDLIVTSDAKKGYILFINDYLYTTSDWRYMAWAYHPIKRRWDCLVFGNSVTNYTSSANGGIFKGKDGEVYLSNAARTYKLMRHATNRQLWEWYSQELSFGETRQIKSITMIKLDATGTVVITYGVDGATPATSGTNEALINAYNKTLRIKLNAAAATSTNYVDSMEIIYRPLLGAR